MEGLEMEGISLKMLSASSWGGGGRIKKCDGYFSWSRDMQL